MNNDIADIKKHVIVLNHEVGNIKIDIAILKTSVRWIRWIVTAILAAIITNGIIGVIKW